MSRQQRLILLPVAGTILFGLLIGVYMGVWKRKRSAKSKKSDAPASVIRHSVETPADETLKYWTADKMRQARATNMPHVNNLERGERQQRSSHAPAPEQD